MHHRHDFPNGVCQEGLAASKKMLLSILLFLSQLIIGSWSTIISTKILPRRIIRHVRKRHSVPLFSNARHVYNTANNTNLQHGEDSITSSSPGGIRLNKVFKATHSRREADALIESGRVCVNGVLVASTDVGRRVRPFCDVISLDGNVIYGWEEMNAIPTEMNLHTKHNTTNSYNDTKYHTISAPDNDNNSPWTDERQHVITRHSISSFEYIKYYKPLGVTCTTDSRVKDNIIDDLLHHGYRPRHRVYPVGRLDKDTSGLILLTSDGRVVNAVLRGENKHAKVYNVMVNDSLTDEDIQRLRDGIVITTVSQRKGRSIEENTLIAKTKKAVVERIGHNSCRLTLVEGRNRQIRKMMEALGLRVVRLHRVEFMGIRLTSSSLFLSQPSFNNTRTRIVNNGAGSRELKRPGDWAYLDEREMNLIENAIQLAQRNK